MDRNCTNCRHYRPAEENESVLDYGECRRMPPVIVMIDDDPSTMFPQVDAQADCGEWRAQQ